MKEEDIEIEKVILGAMLIDNIGRIEALDIIPNSHCFVVPENKIIFSAIQKMSSDGSKVDLLTLAQYLKSTGKYQESGGGKYLANLASKISSAAHVDLHARILLEKHIRIQLHQLLSFSLIKCTLEEENIFELSEFIQKGVTDIFSSNMNSAEPTMAQRIYIELENRLKAQTKGIAGVSTGSRQLDKFTGGFVNSDLWIIGGRPGSGKTSWLVSEVLNLANTGTSVGVISLEMSGEQITQRMISNLSGVDAIKLRNPETLTPEDIKRLPFFEHKISQLPIVMSSPASIRSQSIRTKAHIWKKKFGIQILFIDFLQKISGTQVNTKFGSRDQEMGEVSGTLKTIAKELDIPVVCLASLNRDVEKRSDKIPQLSDLRESGNIESDADLVLFFMRPEYYGLTGTFLVGSDQYPVDGLAVGSLAKNRHGSVGEMPFRFHKTIMRFSDYDSSDTFENIGF